MGDRKDEFALLPGQLLEDCLLQKFHIATGYLQIPFSPPGGRIE
jgi:hypothetical protein